VHAEVKRYLNEGGFRLGGLKGPGLHSVRSVAAFSRISPVVVDRRGQRSDSSIFIHLPGKDHELDAYMELLTIILESEFGADAADLWCMGLKIGITIPRPRSKARTRQACREAARLFKRMVEAGVIKGKSR
jgi:hypothetical protein